MFSRKRTRSTDPRGPIRASRHETSLRGDTLFLASLLMILLAFAAPACPATTSSNAESDGTANASGNPARDASPSPAAGLDVSGDVSAPQGDGRPAFTASKSLTVINDPAGIALKSDRKSRDPDFSAKCLRTPVDFCRALKNKPIVLLAMLQTAALISDGVTTRQFLSRGFVEVNPFTRVLIGTRPTWARMAPMGAVQVVTGMWLSERMARSRHLWVRRCWWLPQMMGIAANVAATAHNTALH
jgi:hypothetical protein